MSSEDNITEQSQINDEQSEQLDDSSHKNNSSVEDIDIRLIKNQLQLDSFIQIFLHKIYEAYLNQFNKQKLKQIVFVLVVIYLIIPTLQTMLLISLFISNNYIVQIMLIVYLYLRIIKKYYRSSFLLLQNENSLVKHLLIIFDMENIYLIIKYPKKLADIFNERNRLLCDRDLFFTYSAISYIFGFIDKECLILYQTYLYIFFLSTHLAVTLKVYSRVYPKQNLELTYWLCNKSFAVTFLHGIAFFQLFITILSKYCEISWLFVILNITVYFGYSKIINISPLFFHVVVDIPFIRSNFKKQYLLNQGYVPYTNRILFCIYQKIILLIISILTMIYLSFSSFSFIHGLTFITLTIISLLILINRYRKQKELLYGQQPMLIEIYSQIGLQQLLKSHNTNNNIMYDNVKVIHVVEENISVNDIINTLFYCCEQADVIFKNKNYKRITIFHYFKTITINKISDLNHLDFKDINKHVIKNIQMIFVKEEQLPINRDIYKKLVYNNFKIQIFAPNKTCPFYLKYFNYVKSIKLVRYQLLAYYSTIKNLLLNNPLEIYFDLYDQD